ncbi:adhesion G protein-coupled receptor E3-like [Patiria miniata]|uniref:GAIN-B domain-containing protein n=1 Tax=Patiria miniata TaxID=46514 RepID=A0A914AN85_PATMI|nr:adhesion G protein-coupled receptor E3-like [Patiria miniata]
MSAAWRQPDYSDCQIPTPGELLNRLTLLSHFASVDPGDVIKATFQLAQMLAPSTTDGNANSADEYSVLVELLEMVAALPDKFTECRQADMENFANSFLQAVDNILHPSNIATWTGNQQVEADTVRIMDAVESFTAQTARENCELSLTSHEDTAAFFEGKYDHIVFRKSRETPGGFSGLSYSATSARASITLPPEVFQGVTDEQVTLLVVLYPSIGDLLDSVPTTTQPSPGSTMKVNSAVVTSSGVHQSGQAFEKLSVPLCINFTKKNPTFGKEESCVYLSRTESGESQWLTDGCWMNEQRNGSVHCCCNHMTSFALLSATETVEPYHLLLLTYVMCSASCFIILLSALILFSVR